MTPKTRHALSRIRSWAGSIGLRIPVRQANLQPPIEELQGFAAPFSAEAAPGSPTRLEFSEHLHAPFAAANRNFAAGCGAISSRLAAGAGLLQTLTGRRQPGDSRFARRARPARGRLQRAVVADETRFQQSHNVVPFLLKNKYRTYAGAWQENCSTENCWPGRGAEGLGRRPERLQARSPPNRERRPLRYRMRLLWPFQYPSRKRAIVQFAGRQARKLRLEVDRARALVVGETLAAKADQLGLRLPAGLKAGHELHDGLDLLAHLLVRRAEDRGVRDL